jgi:hypothetical protein
MELLSWHPSGAQNFEVAPRFLEKLCPPGVAISHNRSKSEICFVTASLFYAEEEVGDRPSLALRDCLFSIYSQRPCMSGSPYLCPQLQGVPCQNFTVIIVTLYTKSFSVK